MRSRPKQRRLSQRGGFHIMVVPVIKPVRHWHLSALALRSVGMVVLTLVVLAAVAAVHFVQEYREVLADVSELEALRSVNRQQASRLAELDRVTGELASRLRQLEVSDARIRAFLQGENLLPENVQTSSLLDQEPDYQWLVQTGSSPSGTLPRDYHQLTEALSGIFQRTSYTERSLVQLYQLITDAADYFRARPSIWPVVGRITSAYGMRRSPITRAWAFHYGIDIAANYGTQIRATADGVVEFAGYNGLLGYCVILDHGYGIKTLYAHNWRNLVAVNDWVERGDSIALVGSSGSSTGPHLHYEVWVDGDRVDPWTYHLSSSPTDGEH